MSVFRTMLLAAAAAATLVAPGSPALAGGKVTLSIGQDPGSWDPIDTFLVAWAAVSTNIYDGLTYRTPDQKLVPGLATSWEVLDDGKRIRFKLRTGVKFHNGEPFNAEAVKFTFERLLSAEGAKGPQKANYSAISAIDIVDDTTVDMKLSEPDPVLLVKLAGYGAMIVPPKYIAEKGDAFFNANPVGTGAFSFVSYDPKVNIKLKANPDYWGGKPKIDDLEYRFIAEPGTAVAELQAGRVDIVVPPSLPIAMLKTVEADTRLKVASVAGPTVYALRFNTRDGITKDEKVRRAIVHAVDRDAIIKSILAGQAKPIATFQSDLSFGSDPALKPLAYDPAKAKALLAEAGVAPGAALQIDLRGNDSTFIEVSQAIAAYLSAVGITVTIKPYETNVLLNDIIPAGKTGAMFQQAWGGWTFDFENTAGLIYGTGQKWNPYYSDADLDKLIKEQRAILDRGQREKALQAIAKRTYDQVLDLNLYNSNQIFGYNARVKNFAPVPDNRLKLNEISVD